MSALDKLDRQILNQLQADFPVSGEPYKVIADRLEISEAEVLTRIGVMKSTGLIRRIGGVMNTASLGYVSTLCAAVVPSSRIEAAVQSINNLPSVTHNYLRDHEYNVWFTLTVTSWEEVDRVLQELESTLKIKIVSMPAEKVFKIKVAFDMESKDEV